VTEGNELGHLFFISASFLKLLLQILSAVHLLFIPVVYETNRFMSFMQARPRGKLTLYSRPCLHHLFLLVPVPSS